MSEEMIIRHGAPTLAGIKTGNLFLCIFQDEEKFFAHVRGFNSKLNAKGVMLIPLRIRGNRVLVYIFRPHQLKRILMNEEVKLFLSGMGYRRMSIKEALRRLSQKMMEGEEFPHEIGIFLGYPLADVKGYMKHRGKDAKFGGCWKVYSDVETATETFLRYKKCTNIYCEKYAAGIPLYELTVDQRRKKQRKEVV